MGDDNQSEEVTVTIPVISSWPAPVAIPAEQADDLPASGEVSPVTFHLRGQEHSVVILFRLGEIPENRLRLPLRWD